MVITLIISIKLKKLCCIDQQYKLFKKEKEKKDQQYENSVFFQ